jgi:hypothetical protein
LKKQIIMNSLNNKRLMKYLQQGSNDNLILTDKTATILKDILCYMFKQLDKHISYLPCNDIIYQCYNNNDGVLSQALGYLLNKFHMNHETKS